MDCSDELSSILDNLKETLDKFDQKMEPFSEWSVESALRPICESLEPHNIPTQLIAEKIAFEFYQDHQDELDWGAYYKPRPVLPNADEAATKRPGAITITAQIIEYWSDRSKTAKHPILRARYADLVWDFQKHVTGQAPHYSMAQIVIDSTIEMAEKNCHAIKVEAIDRLERALHLALSLGDSERIQKVAFAIIAYEDVVADDSKLGLWGFAYEMLFDNDKIKLTAGQRQKLLDDMESRLQRASNPDKGQLNPFAVEKAALPLAYYYRKKGRKEDVKRVIIASGNAFLQAGLEQPALVVSSWLQLVHATYKQFGLKNEAEKIAIQLDKINERAASELKPISVIVETPKEELEGLASQLTAGDFDVAMRRIAEQFTPKKSEVESQLKELSDAALLQSIIPVQLQDDTGRPLAKIGPLEEDLESHAFMGMSKILSLDSVLLRLTMELLKEKYPTFEDLFLKYIFHLSIFKDDKKPIIQRGVKAYAKGCHIEAVHLLVPQIESALRVLVEEDGGSILKPARRGAFHLKGLDDLFREPKIIEVFGEDIIFYFRVLLSDQRGWNIRNNVCHGLSEATYFESRVSDRIMHVLLCLALARKEE
jgi:hypothetical protein